MEIAVEGLEKPSVTGHAEFKLDAQASTHHDTLHKGLSEMSGRGLTKPNIAQKTPIVRRNGLI